MKEETGNNRQCAKFNQQKAKSNEQQIKFSLSWYQCAVSLGYLSDIENNNQRLKPP